MSTATADRPLGLDAVATLALAAYSAVAALGFARVFGDWEFTSDLLAIVVVGHGASFVLRRLRLPGWLAVGLMVVVVGWLIAWLHYSGTFAALFPTTETWSIAGDDISLARQQFRDAVAPVAYVGGFAMLASIGTGLAVVLGDTFAFRAGARGEALVPAGVLFVFVAAVGSGRDRVSLTVLFVAAGFLAATMLRVLFESPPRTTLGRARPRLALVMPAAILTASLVAIVAWALGPRLPGANAEPIYQTRGRSGGVTEVISPLVDIRGRLVKRSATILFDVRASEPAYWRVSSLPEFDGETWRLPDRALEDVEGALGSAPEGSIENRQRVTIAALDGSLVPAAAEPIAASGPSLRWSPDTATLVKIDDPLVPSEVFDVVSAMPRFTPEQLRAATSSTPPDRIHLELPDGFPAAVADLAAEVITADARTPYQAARQLQEWFRTEFEYSLEVPQGHSNSAIEAFVRQRIGYCEQFAGTFAAMLRSVGIPTRVSVGFTPGLLQPDGSYQVLGRNAHAWPEVWFDQFGWVAFEPTPGRGAPGAESHTGVAPAQDETVGGGETGEGDDNGGSGDPAPAAPVEPRPPTDPDAVGLEELPGGPQLAEAGESDGGGGLSWRIVWYGFLALIALAWLPLLVRKWRRRHHRGSPDEYVADLWRRTVHAVEIVGVRCPSSSTPTEVADAAAPRLAVASRPLHSLAAVVTATAYSPPGEYDPTRERRSGSSVLTDAARWCRQIEEIARDSMSPGERFRHHFTVWR